MHAVQQLYLERKSRSTKAFKARGAGVKRCLKCQIDEQFCICDMRQMSQSEIGFVLIMHDSEVLKPSNTGRLIADVVPNTYAFIWQRLELDKKLEALLNDKTWQPIVVFPTEYAASERATIDLDELNNSYLPNTSAKKPLFILLDGTWREAKKMFRKSPYLDKFPVLGLASDNGDRNYHIRQSVQEQQFATAEVAAKVLELSGEHSTGKHLALWFDVFSYRYQQGVKQTNKGDEQAVVRYQSFLSNKKKAGD